MARSDCLRCQLSVSQGCCDSGCERRMEYDRVRSRSQDRSHSSSEVFKFEAIQRWRWRCPSARRINRGSVLRSESPAAIISSPCHLSLHVSGPCLSLCRIPS